MFDILKKDIHITTAEVQCIAVREIPNLWFFNYLQIILFKDQR